MYSLKEKFSDEDILLMVRKHAQEKYIAIVVSVETVYDVWNDSTPVLTWMSATVSFGSPLSYMVEHFLNSTDDMFSTKC